MRNTMTVTLAERAYVHGIMEALAKGVTIRGLLSACAKSPTNSYGETFAFTAERLAVVVDDLCASGDAEHTGGRGLNRTYRAYVKPSREIRWRDE
jgi:hypothetical protein